MRQDIIRSLSVIMASSAMLTVLSTSAFAQETSPALDVPAGDSAVIAPVIPDSAISAPAIGSAGAGTPTITLPEITLRSDPTPPAPASGNLEARIAPSQPAQSPTTSGSAAEAPDPSNAVAAGRPKAAVAPSGVSASSRPDTLAKPASDPDAASELAGNELPSDALEPMAAAVAPEDGAAPPTAAGSSADELSEALPEAAIAGLLGLLGIGAAGGLVAMTRRRKRGDRIDYREAVAVEPQLERPTLDRPAAAERRINRPLPERAEWRPRNTVQEAAMAMMADGPPPVGRERADLLRAMTAASPDRFNPFTSPKGRRHRARLILQTREQFWEDRVAQPFDWRTYEPTARSAKREPAELVTV